MTIKQWVKKEQLAKKRAMVRKRKFTASFALSLIFCLVTLSLLMSGTRYLMVNGGIDDYAEKARAHGWSYGKAGYNSLVAERDEIASKDPFFGWCYKMGQESSTSALIRDVICILIGALLLVSLLSLVMHVRRIYVYWKYKERKRKEAREIARQVRQNKRLFGI